MALLMKNSPFAKTFNILQCMLVPQWLYGQFLVNTKRQFPPCTFLPSYSVPEFYSFISHAMLT